MDVVVNELISLHGLEPHPEGGHYRRVFASRREVVVEGRPRPAMTAIRYLLAAGVRSAWHRVDADEAWHWAQGGTLELLRFDAAARRLSRTRLGPPPDGDDVSCIVPAGVWQAARAHGSPVLATCTVAPGFVWDGFELLAADGEVARELDRLGALQP